MVECPVCGADVDDTNPAETDYSEETYAPTQVDYEGETYSFCSEAHREAFEENPEQYA